MGWPIGFEEIGGHYPLIHDSFPVGSRAESHVAMLQLAAFGKFRHRTGTRIEYLMTL
jgi:hypothetical protein